MGKIKRYVAPISFVLLGMVFIGFAVNMRGLLVPVFKSKLGIDDSAIGYLISVIYLGMVIFQYLGGIAVSRWGYKRVYLMSLIVFLVSFLAIHFALNYWILLVGMFIFSCGISFFYVSTTTVIPQMADRQGALMNITYFCYGLGTAVGQRVTGVLLQHYLTWRQLYLINGILFGGLLGLLSLINFPQQGGDNCQRTEKGTLWTTITNQLVIFYVIALGFYLFAEHAVANWFANFMKVGYGFTTEKSSLYLSLFFGVFTIGRLLGSIVVEKLNYFKVLFIFIGAAVILFFTGMLGGENFLLLISISGFFFSIIFPTLIAAVNDTFSRHTSYIMGVILTCASIIDMLGNVGIGYVTQLFGVYHGFLLVPISLLITAGAVLLINYRKKLFGRENNE